MLVKDFVDIKLLLLLSQNNLLAALVNFGNKIQALFLFNSTMLYLAR